MRAGMPGMEAFVSELVRQKQVKRDFIADTRTLHFETFRAEDEPSFETLSIGRRDDADFVGRFRITENAQDQLAARLKIPRAYFRRLREDHPSLLESNVNHLLAMEPEKRMVRTLDGDARAVLSNRYKRIDNLEVAEAILPALAEASAGHVTWESLNITADRMYIKGTFPRVQAEVRKGDVVQSGFTITNSEVGKGSLKIRPLVFRLICTNGMTAPESIGSVTRRHLGRAIADEGEIFRQETIAADNRAFLMKARDIISSLVDPQKFEVLVESLREATTLTLDDPIGAVTELNNEFALSDEEGLGVLRYLCQGSTPDDLAGDFTKYGLIQAVTRASQDAANYDRASELEEIGGKILTLPPRTWSRIARATQAA